ncbi:gated mechanosensitive channel [Tothia fuscella]|uniref:Gated mechanosensitive channel n=1 Tax=Tothia fuscella TaxID=1048955 RepID=A0A9P4NZC2_9PEZI|nr:gated mechanosensitive channel [Tothia fuscella]
MPRLDDRAPGSGSRSGSDYSFHDLERDVTTRWASAWDSFSNFALRDNVLEVAVGLILAAAFSAVANSLVTDIILPIISLLPFIDKNLNQKFVTLRRGQTKKIPYNTIQQALDDGAIVWPYGSFLDKVLRFLLIALALFTIAKTYSWAAGDNIVKKQVKCKYCRKYISDKAKRCVNCTTWQDGREEKSVTTAT